MRRGERMGKKVERGCEGERGLTFSNIIPSEGRTQFHEYLAVQVGTTLALL